MSIVKPTLDFVLSGFTHAAAQARAMRALSERYQTRSDDPPVTDADEGLESVQSLAYDADRWPHCIDAHAAR